MKTIPYIYRYFEMLIPHCTPASSLWPQFWTPIGGRLQRNKSISDPEQAKSSKCIGPAPRPKCAESNATALVLSILKQSKNKKQWL